MYLVRNQWFMLVKPFNFFQDHFFCSVILFDKSLSNLSRKGGRSPVGSWVNWLLNCFWRMLAFSLSVYFDKSLSFGFVRRGIKPFVWLQFKSSMFLKNFRIIFGSVKNSFFFLHSFVFLASLRFKLYCYTFGDILILVEVEIACLIRARIDFFNEILLY